MKFSIKSKLALVFGVVAFTATLGYFVGGRLAEQRIYAANEIAAVGELASSLFMLEQLEKGDVNDVKRILQASTNPQLDWIIDHGVFDADSKKFRCLLLLKLKTYREQRQLFKGEDWNYLWKVPGMREAELRRQSFLIQTAPALCEWTTDK